MRALTLGHTRYPDTRVFANGSRQYNTDSWMTIIAEQEQLYRERRQLTYLEIEDDARLRCWNAARRIGSGGRRRHRGAGAGG